MMVRLCDVDYVITVESAGLRGSWKREDRFAVVFLRAVNRDTAVTWAEIVARVDRGAVGKALRVP